MAWSIYNTLKQPRESDRILKPNENSGVVHHF